MKKHRKKSKKSAAEVKSADLKQEKQSGAEESTQNEEPDPFDFGGIPSRDLKKNLGCG